MASSAYSTSGNSYKFHSVHLARNARLQARVEFAELSMKEDHERTGVKQRMADEFDPAQGWAHVRRVITRLEYGEQGNNPGNGS